VRGLPFDTGKHRQRFDPRGDVDDPIGVKGRHGAVMTGVRREQHVEQLRPAGLADDQPVGPHPERLTHQVAHRHLAGAFDVGWPSFQPDDVWMVNLQLSGIFDGDEALARIGLGQ
jgi:hypothetical protein